MLEDPKDTAALREIVGETDKLRDASEDSDGLGVTEGDMEDIGQREEVGLEIDERDSDEQPLELKDAAALREFVGVADEQRDVSGENDKLGVADVVAVIGLREAVRLAIDEREIDEQALGLGLTAELRDIDGVADELRELNGEIEGVGVTEEVMDEDGQRDDV